MKQFKADPCDDSPASSKGRGRGSNRDGVDREAFCKDPALPKRDRVREDRLRRSSRENDDETRIERRGGEDEDGDRSEDGAEMGFKKLGEEEGGL